MCRYTADIYDIYLKHSSITRALHLTVILAAYFAWKTTCVVLVDSFYMCAQVVRLQCICGYG